MKKLILIALLVVCIHSLFAVITQDLEDVLKVKTDNELININIILKENINLHADPILKSMESKENKREYVKMRLKAFAQESQKNVIQFLQKQNNSKVQEISSLWISNVISCKASKQVIEALAFFNEIEIIDWDDKHNMLPDDNISKYSNESNKTREITWNVTKVNADDVWNLGYTGEGVLVAVVDTGINYNHNDLQDHMWENDSYPNHGYDFNGNDNNPMDDNGHGTHCAGTIAGDGTAGSQTGIAPDATIMACKILDSTGNGYESDVWEAIEFCVEHDVDVMSLSIGWAHSWNPQRATWRNTMNNALAANVVASVAAANFGDQQWSYPVPDNVACPGDCPPPWLHPDQTLTGGISAVICVGATDIYDNIASFSSRGPVTWENINPFNDYAYEPEIGLIRPDVCAPGVNIKSLAHYSNTGYEDGWDGTSMATPLNAGVIALMLTKNNTISPAQIDQILEETAVHITTTKSNDYGSGRVNALAAVNATPAPTSPPSQVHEPLPVDNATCIAPSCVNFSWQNGSGGIPDYYKFSLGTDNPPTNIISENIVQTNSIEITNMLENEMEYFWQIEACNDYGTCSSDVWSFETMGYADEDFESGDFSACQWSFDGHQDWEICSTSAASGIYSARSGSINGYQNSVIILELDLIESGDLLFWKKVSSQENNDKLKFYMDGTLLEEWSGEVEWSQEIFPIECGHHELMWKYQKLDHDYEGDDCAWIDYLIFPETGEINPPILELDISEINHEMNVNQAANFYMNLSNSGGSILEYDLSLDYSCPETGWIALNHMSGDIEATESEEIRISLYSTNLNYGTYSAEILVESNAGETISIPINLLISANDADEHVLPICTDLITNYPNPFNPETTIQYAIAQQEKVVISIYNTKGQLIKTLINETKSPGFYTTVWDGTNSIGQTVSSGIYYYQISTASLHKMKKMIMIK